MTLLFPGIDALRLAISTNGLLPTDVLLAPATVSTDAENRLTVGFDGTLSKKTLAELAALGVVAARRHIGDVRPVACWPQIVPVEKLATPPALSTSAPVLFELAAADLPDLVGELLRLGNDRQQVLAVAGQAGDRVLLRVVGPPYYTLLRALDDPAGTVRAFAEAAPRVWVQVGYTHPFAARLKPADGQMLLLGPPVNWQPLPDGPFRDLYEVLDLHLPAARVEWEATAEVETLTVPLTLAAGSGTDVVELWVLRGEAAGRTLDEFVREADARLVQRLKFAVADAPDGRVIVLRSVAGRQMPPAIELPGAVGFKPHSRLPNLCVPVGRRLAPTLRRDAVRALLADNPDRLVWLYPEGEREFVPESVPETAFRPLAEWVEYVIGEHHQPLAEWVAATTFDFEPFVCGEQDRPKPPRPAGDVPKVRKPVKASATKAPSVLVETPTAHTDEAIMLTPVPTPSVEWRLRRDELEKQFLAVDGPLDHPDRVALWPELAVANAGAEEPGEAAVCWLNAAWASDQPAATVGRWAATEFPNGPPADPSALLAVSSPTPGEARRTVAAALAASYRVASPTWLPAAHSYLTAHENKLPVRAAWLAAVRLAELSGADALGLARMRDRLLARMLDEGLNPERDLPGFLRFAGLTDSERVRLVRAGAGRLHEVVRRWCEDSLKAQASLHAPDQLATPGYVDLLFAFGLARLGDTATAAQLLAVGRHTFAALPPDPPKRVLAAGWVAGGYGYRVEQATAGKAHVGGLPASLLARQEALRSIKGAGQSSSEEQLAGYAIDQLRFNSRVLEPMEKLHPYRDAMGRATKFLDTLRGLELLTEPAVLARRVRELYDAGADGRATPATRIDVLGAALPLAHRVGESFALELVGKLTDILAAPIPADAGVFSKYGYLLDRGLFLAGFYDRREAVGRLIDLFVGLARGRPEEQRFELVKAVAVQGLRGLRKLGLKDEIDKLAGKLPEVAFGGHPATGVPARYLAKPPLLGLAVSAALAVAAGWQLVGLADRAAPVLADAEGLLLGPAADKLSVKDYPVVVKAYLAAAAFGPADVGMERMTRLFVALREPRLVGLVKNGRTSAAIYSEFHHGIAEEAVLAIAGDEFALGPAGHRLLEEDEQLVRRRLHRDMGRVLERGL